MALAGDPTAMRLCMERVLPPCRERTVKCSLPPIEGALTEERSGPSTREVSLAMNAVTSALARGEITPGEAKTVAGVVDTFVRAIETTKKGGTRLNLRQILTARNYDEDNSDGDDYDETGEYEETDDYDSEQAAGAGRATATPTPAVAPGSRFNQYERFCCRFAAGAAIGNN